MERKRTLPLLFLSAMVLCASCKKTAVVYDSAAQEAEILEQKEDGKDAAETDGTMDTGSSVPICVYVCGEVLSPGIYELPEGSRIADAVKAAGGMTENAAQTYLNLAEYVKDEQKIEVPSVREAEEQEEASRQQMKGLVNLNRASEEELMTLTGIGEAKAKDILRYREQHGKFKDIEELMEIPGIKAGVFQKIKDQITI